MHLIKICAVYYIFLNIVVEIHTLEPSPIDNDNNIADTEKAIRNTVDKFFTAFKIQGIRTKPKIKQFSTVHNFFVSITLLDCNSHKEVARLSRVKTIDNNARHFIAQINEVLNEDDKSYEENENVTAYIQKFIKELKRLKENIVPKEENVINAEILKYLYSDRYSPANVTTDNIPTSKASNDSENEDIFDNDGFWQPSGRRIYQGKRTSIKRFPFLASVHIFDRFTCAGSVIKNDLVITSSSCLQIAWNNRFFRENPAFLSVRVGCNYFQFCGDKIAVLEIYFHPSYNPKTLRNNIAIMRLSRKISFHHSRGRVKKIMIDRNPWALPSNSRAITAIGWGAKDVTNIVYDIHKNKLSYADLDFFPFLDCQEHYSKEFVTRENFCAGFYTVGGGACNRDAGGPGVIDNTLMGVISFGSPECGATEAPTVFTKLGFYSDWIDEIMEMDTIETVAKTTGIYIRTTFFLYQKPTTKTFKMQPFASTPTTTAYLDETEMLRLPQKESFRDFLSTMFSSEEIATYVDVSDTGTKGKVHTDQKGNKSDIARVSVEHKRKESKIRMKPVVKITDYFNDETKKSLHNKNKLGESTTKSQMKITVMENAINDDKSLEEDIISLIDNLNLEDVMNPKNGLFETVKNRTIKENSNSLNQSNTVKGPLKGITTTKKVKLSEKNQVKTSNKGKNLTKETTVFKKVTTSLKAKPEHKTVSWLHYTTPLNKVDRGGNEVTSNMIQHKITTGNILRPVTDSNEAENQESKNVDSPTDPSDEHENSEEGISIPVEPFMDLTLRNSADAKNKKGALSEAQMFELISLAIEEQTKQLKINKQKRYLL